MRGEEGATDGPNMQQLLALILQQNGRFREEMEELKGQLGAQTSAPRVVEIVAETVKASRPSEKVEAPLSSQSQTFFGGCKAGGSRTSSQWE